MTPRSSRGQGIDVKTSTLGRLFEGWQAGLVVVLIAMIAAVISVPRPEMPDEVPMPAIDGDAVRALSQQEAELAGQVREETLSFEVRAVGDAFRRYGLADARSDAVETPRVLEEMRTRLVGAQDQGPKGLLRLRAYQMHQFLNELEAFERTGVESKALRELAGGFIAQARRVGWIVEEGTTRRMIARRDEREALFRRRWAEVVGLDEGPLGLTLDEQRVFYAFLLTHPVVRFPGAGERDDAALCRAANTFVLRKVVELGRIDPSYPTGYAVGVLQLRLGRPRDAVGPLAQFVERGDGQWMLRARNALREAQERLERQAVR